MFPLRTSQVHHHVQRTYRRLSAGEIRIKVQRVTRYFSGETLPVPTDEVKDAWNDLPNANADALKTKMSFPRAPPPTPTGSTFVIGPSTYAQDELTANGTLHMEANSRSLYDIDSPTPDVVAFQAIPAFTEEATLMQGPSDDSDQDPHCQQESESSGNSEHESAPVSGHESTALTELNNTISRWISVYRTQGTDNFFDALVQAATESPQTVSRMCQVAIAVIRKVNRISNLEGKALENVIRFSALAAFKAYWTPDGTWTEVSSTSTKAVSLTLRGINLAGFLGGLFDTGISTAKDIQLCLSMLMEGNKHVDRLCAMHALLVHSNDKLCKNRNRPALMEFRDAIASRDDSGAFVWGTSTHSKALIDDILHRIEEWMALQAEKQKRLKNASSKRLIPSRAVGPRLRNGTERR